MLYLFACNRLHDLALQKIHAFFFFALELLHILLEKIFFKVLTFKIS